MKKTVFRIIPFELYEYGTIALWLQQMAAEGLALGRVYGCIARFAVEEPINMQFEIIHAPLGRGYFAPSMEDDSWAELCELGSGVVFRHEARGEPERGHEGTGAEVSDFIKVQRDRGIFFMIWFALLAAIVAFTCGKGTFLSEGISAHGVWWFMLLIVWIIAFLLSSIVHFRSASIAKARVKGALTGPNKLRLLPRLFNVAAVLLTLSSLAILISLKT